MGEFALSLCKRTSDVESLMNHVWRDATPLQCACQYGQLTTVRLLLKVEAANIVTSSTKKNASSNSLYPPLNRTLLFCAASGRSLPIIKYLLQNTDAPDVINKRCSLDYAKQTPSYAASRVGRREIVRLLLAAGAYPNKGRPWRHGNWSCLHMAAKRGHLEVVRILLDHGAKINVRTVPMFSGGGWGEIRRRVRRRKGVT